MITHCKHPAAHIEQISMLPAQRRKRTHSPEFRAELVRQCQQPGVSISAIALANQVNANLLRKWIYKGVALTIVQFELLNPAIPHQKWPSSPIRRVSCCNSAMLPR